MSITRVLVAFGLSLPLVGCHSPYVDATVSNKTGATITLIEVDYPSASFGTQNLAAGADYHYRFKVLGTGYLKLTYTDNLRKDHTSPGPGLDEGAEGPLKILINPDGIVWQPSPGLKATPPTDAPAPAIQPSVPPLR